MLKISYKEYLNKVYGCFLGKALIGNIGAPYEGMKQYLEFDYSEKFFEKMIPNDDLDLQVLWLEVLEKKGKYFTSRDLADAFHEKCPYAPGEYAFFKSNYEKGIYPPYSGSFGSRMFANGMGSPIRSEIWACIAPNNPKLAAEYARRDSCLDHAQGSDSENGEVFFAVMEALAFAKKIPDSGREQFALEIIREAEAYVPKESRLRRLIDDTIDWYKENGDFKYVRGKIIRFYGDTEATDCYQNIGFILLSMLSGNMDFLQCGMDALKCGFDTDCTCATVGALLGILYGAEEISARYGLSSAFYVLGVNAVRRSDSVKDLSEDIARVGYYFSTEENDKIIIEGYDGEVVKISKPKEKVGFFAQYCGEPTIAIGETKNVLLKFENKTGEQLKIKARLEDGEAISISPSTVELTVAPHGDVLVDAVVTVDANVKSLPAVNVIKVKVYAGGQELNYDFGYSGQTQWAIAGPFWQNIIEVPQLKEGEGYWGYVAGGKIGNLKPIDLIRHYHMNSIPAFGSMTPDEVFANGDKNDPRFIPNYINTPYSDFVLEDYEKFNGQANYYLRTVVISNEERSASLQIGFTDTCRVWFNGKEVAYSFGSNKFTHENLHIEGLELKKGENDIVVMLSKIGEVTRFGFDLVTGSACTDRITAIATKNLSLSEKNGVK